MKTSIKLITGALLVCALLATGAQARILYVPSEVPTVQDALDIAGAGDIIAVAVGTYRITGDGHRVPAGVTITTDTGMPGGVVFVEEPAYWGDWRREPVFVVNTVLGPTNEVTFDGIIFKDFTNTYGPNHQIDAPIIGVMHGKLNLKNCSFDTYYGTAVKFEGGFGEIAACSFERGHGQPAALEFAGRELVLNDCSFRYLTQRFPGDVVNPDTRPAEGSILKFVSGETTCNCSMFENNGPVTYVIDVAPGARLLACESCLQTNDASWQGRVQDDAFVQLTCCTALPTRWQVYGTFIVTDSGDGAPAGAVATEGKTLSQLRSLFE